MLAMEPMMLKKVCLRAAELVEQGHCKGNWATERGQATMTTSAKADAWCLNGALVRAHYELTGQVDPAVTTEAASALMDRIMAQMFRAAGLERPPVFSGSVGWNDHTATTGEDVAGFLRFVAEAIEEA
jgi:hypothetical protein